MLNAEPDFHDLIQGLVALLQSHGLELVECQGMVRDMMAETWPIMANIRAILAPSPSELIH